MRFRLGIVSVAVALFAAAFSHGASAVAPAPAFSVLRTISVPAGAEIVAVSPARGTYLAVAGDTAVTVLDFGSVQAAAERCSADMTRYGTNVTSVAFVQSSIVLAAVKADPNPGRLVAISAFDCHVLWDRAIGIGPDSVVVSPNGRYAVIAIEDEETEVGTIDVCPAANVRPGRVEIVELNPRGEVRAITSVPLNLVGIAGINCQSDPQPEGIAISDDNRYAYVTLQENNALATISLRTGAVESIISLGLTTHLADLTDGAAISITENMTARRESDGISFHGGYLFTADEGDSSKTGSEWSGGRTLSVFSVANGVPAFVADSGAQIEQLVADAGGWAVMQSRSNNRGPEQEGVTTFTVNRRVYAAVTLERANGVAIFDVTDPEAPLALAFIPTGAGPEGIVHIPTRRLLVSANEVARTLTIICASTESNPSNECR